MADGKPTPVVQTRLTELQAQIGNLREVLRHAREWFEAHNADVQECLAMGFQSLTDAENVSRQIQDIVMGEGGPLGLPPQIKSGESGGRKLPEPRFAARPEPRGIIIDAGGERDQRELRCEALHGRIPGPASGWSARDRRRSRRSIRIPGSSRFPVR